LSTHDFGLRRISQEAKTATHHFNREKSSEVRLLAKARPGGDANAGAWRRNAEAARPEEVIQKGYRIVDPNARVSVHIAAIEARRLRSACKEIQQYAQCIGNVDGVVTVTVAPAEDHGLCSQTVNVAGGSTFQERAAPVVGKVIVEIGMNA